MNFDAGLKRKNAKRMDVRPRIAAVEIIVPQNNPVAGLTLAKMKDVLTRTVSVRPVVMILIQMFIILSVKENKQIVK